MILHFVSFIFQLFMIIISILYVFIVILFYFFSFLFIAHKLQFIDYSIILFIDNIKFEILYDVINENVKKNYRFLIKN